MPLTGLPCKEVDLISLQLDSELTLIDGEQTTLHVRVQLESLTVTTHYTTLEFTASSHARDSS
jgi:hypothetical protein